MLRRDALAGLTVAMVAAPLSLAIAIASGARPETGLVTAIVGGFLVSFLGGSRVQIGGPTGAFIVVVYGIIAAHGHDGLVLATLMAGLLLLLAAALRLGDLVAYIPEPVIDGFTIGIGIVIAASQLKDFFGLTPATLPADFIAKLAALWAARAQAGLAAPLLAVATMILIVLFRRAAPRWPGLVAAVALASAAPALSGIGIDTIHSRFGALPATLPTPALPGMRWDRIVDLLPSAVVIAFLAGVESLLSAMVADRMIGGRHRPNAEMLAQGAANLGSALVGGLPATGAIARTATNVHAGAITPVAGMIHALVVLLAMLALPQAMGMIAMPALAGLLMLTAWNMTEPHKWRERLSGRPSDAALLLLTATLTVLADLTIAIGVGVAIGLALRLRRREAPKNWSPPER